MYREYIRNLQGIHRKLYIKYAPKYIKIDPKYIETFLLACVHVSLMALGPVLENFTR